ncbi:MAG: cell division protein FtsA [Spirochaetia bacterium]
MNQNLLVSLDLGSADYKLAVAYIHSDRQLELIALKSHPSKGLKKGAVLNMEACVTSLKELFDETETEIGLNIDIVHAAYTGENIDALNSHGVAATGLRGRGRPITRQDKEQVIAAAQAIVIPQDRSIAHIFPLRYMVDNQEMVKEPLNMVGVRLEAEAHIIVTPTTLLDHLNLAISRTGRQVADFMYSPIALGEAILSKEEKERGTILIDLGLSTTKITYYQYGEPYYNFVLPIGSHALTLDLAYMLQISEEIAEDMKMRHGCAHKPLLDREEFAYIPGSSDRNSESISLYYICDVLTARLTDMYSVAQKEINESGWLQRARGIVLGGAGAKLPGAVELAGRIFGRPARLGYSMGIENLEEASRDVSFGGVLGLMKRYRNPPVNWNTPVAQIPEAPRSERSAKRSNIFSWIRDFF